MRDARVAIELDMFVVMLHVAGCWYWVIFHCSVVFTGDFGVVIVMVTMKVGGVSSMLRGNWREYGGRCGWWEMWSRIWYFDNQPSIHASRWEQKYRIDWSIPGLSDIGLERWWIDGMGIMKWVIGSLCRNPWSTATQTPPLRAIQLD